MGILTLVWDKNFFIIEIINGFDLLKVQELNIYNYYL
jgi:hypothetical protein